MEEDTIVSADGKAVAHVFGRSLTPENNEANLQTIRRAVNNHAALVAALQEMVDASIDFRLHVTAHERLVLATDQARAAIRNATK